MFSGFNDFSITTKIRLVFFVIIAAAVAMGAVGIYNLRAVDQKSSDITNNWLVMTDCSHKIYEDLANMRMDSYKYTHVQDAAVLDKAGKDTVMHQDNIKKSLAIYDEALAREAEINPAKAAENKQKLDVLKQEIDKNYKINQSVRSAFEQHDKDAMMKGITEDAFKEYDVLAAALEELTKLNVANANVVNAETAATYAMASKISIALLVFVGVIIMVASSYLRSNIRKGIESLEGISHQLAAGNLRERAKIHSQDELGQLAGLYNQVMEKLAHMVKKIQQNADEVAAASEQLTTGSEQSAQASTQTAEAITKVAQSAAEQNQMADATLGNGQRDTVAGAAGQCGCKDDAGSCRRGTGQSG